MSEDHTLGYDLMSTFKPGDRFAFTAVGTVTTTSNRVVTVRLDGVANERWTNNFSTEFFAAHATLIASPYVPQVGDIVRVVEKTPHYPPVPVGTLLTIVRQQVIDGKTYAMTTYLGHEYGFHAAIELVARKGEVYQ